MRMALGVMVLLMACAVVLAEPTTQPAGNAAEGRIDAAERGVKLAEGVYARGIIEVDVVVAWHRRLAEARLDAAATTEKRKEILAQAVKEAREF